MILILKAADMWLFKRKRKTDHDASKITVSDKVADKIAGAGIKIQQVFAKKMNTMFMNIEIKKLKILLILFCICAGGYSIYLVAESIIGSDKKQNGFKIQQMDVPGHFDKTGDESLIPETYVDDETYQRIKRFKDYMDSLKHNRSSEYDSILQVRPGLMDSVQMLEEIYYSQKQK